MVSQRPWTLAQSNANTLRVRLGEPNDILTSTSQADLLMQEDLLGYLLGALEPDEMRRVEQWLREDAEARREMAELERVLKRLEEAEEFDGDESLDSDDLAPPADLVSRTLANLPPLPPLDHAPVPAGSGPEELGAEELEPAGWGPNERESPHPASDFGALSLSSTDEDGGRQTWNLRDWGASVVAAIILLALALPTLLEGRFAARKAACQNNLRELGLAMTQFADRNAQSRLPSVAPYGYQAFAGIYAPRLHGSGLLDRRQQTFCPSIGPREFWGERWAPERAPQELNAVLPSRSVLVTLETLDEIGREVSLARSVMIGEPDARERKMQAIEILRWIQMTAGGDYAYTLGVRDGGQFSSPRFESRTRFAVMSDAAVVRVNPPNPMTAGHASYRFNVTSHGGRGINVLYEDGHVGFLPTGSLDKIPDNPLVNNAGLLEAGVTLDDASLGPSWQAPFIHATQR